jgi:hypothetical protein
MGRPSIAQLEAILQSEEEVEIEILPNGPCTCTLRINTMSLPTDSHQGQKGMDEKAIMASQWPAHPW